MTEKGLIAMPLDLPVFEELLSRFGIHATKVWRDLSSLGAHVWNSEDTAIRIEWHARREPELQVILRKADGAYDFYRLPLSSIGPESANQIIDRVKSGRFALVSSMGGMPAYIQFEDIAFRIHAEKLAF